ncbi:MAG: hypothetical protein Q7R49_02350 [Candidatus Daviesbacteria bacterium]|nr:hypothetical protein [Candidatus Daviesbacteria bacterium]
MAKADNLKNTVMDAMAEFYQKYIKPDMEETIERKLEEKFEEKLGPIKASIMILEKNVSVALGDYKGQQLQVSDHEKRITALENQV